MTDTEPRSPETPRPRPGRSQWTLVSLILIFTITVTLLKLVSDAGLGQTAAFYIGIPAILAIMLALSAPARSTYGVVLKGTTIFLLLSMILAGEGLVCILFAAPIVYATVVAIAVPIDYARKRNGRAHVVVVPAVLIGILAMEGTAPVFTPPSKSTVTATSVVTASAADVAAAIDRPLDFAGTHRPAVLRVGFPEPIAESVDGVQLGDRRVVTFAGANPRPALMKQHHWGHGDSEVTFAIEDRTDESVTFRTVSDTTPIASWLAWESSEVRWQPIDKDHTEITWEITYNRELAPSWYFGPLQRYFTSKSAEYLISALDL
ncbi:hypothetical protein IEU95_02390 [Hoyosella rhizosphaerae]|uniref:Polyketide cyclase n=1 Tax=Hoyosella rhizosphaerae TaxID=1755582 RepID=A0A916XF19_9ACTN|nr:hypothetical protein [Hoyosella rhizosphaerae]MBN4925664.1 hypothetical protein [Hoyosella rhizosphaerae]GGC68852.1 hypothetical protein GCM10011410_22090 [Hoyosella rhizosphaerae]